MFGVGPTTVLDKSTYQMLSVDEADAFRRHFLQNVTPMLMAEILGDLAKLRRKGAPAASLVAALARKFEGSGPPVSMGAQDLAVLSLLGERIPMDGRIVPANVRTGTTRDGVRGAIVDLTDWNYAILRWQRGEFSDEELALSTGWRSSMKGIDPQAFCDSLDSEHVVIPRASSLREADEITRDLLGQMWMQEVGLRWLLGKLEPSEQELAEIATRWASRTTPFLADGAPYATFYLRVLLFLVVAMKNGLIPKVANTLVDTQYLFDLPFCMVFSSADNVHLDIAPFLLRPDQTLVTGEALKADLKRIAAEWAQLSDRAKLRRDFAMASYPTPYPDSIVCDVWRRYMRPWRPGMGNRAADVTPEEAAQAIEEAERLYAESESAVS